MWDTRNDLFYIDYMYYKTMMGYTDVYLLTTSCAPSRDAIGRC